MKRLASISVLLMLKARAFAVARFPKPDFHSGYQYPDIVHTVPNETFWSWMDLGILTLMLLAAVWAVHRAKSRRIILGISLVSVLYFGFYRSGCVCSLGSIQNVALAIADPGYHLPLVVLLLFLLPLVFALFAGRVFCAGVCPIGALQELVNVRNFRISRPVTVALGVIPWIYLAFAILYAATRSQFIICRFDPFIGIFRMGGDIGMIVFGVLLLLLSVFVGRPFCQFLCPYGALLGLFSRFSARKVEITSPECINCSLCHHACPVDAIRPPSRSSREEAAGKGIKRVLLYLCVLPLLTVGGALLLDSQHDSLSLANKQVRLLHLLQTQEETATLQMAPEVEAFHEMGGDVQVLEEQVGHIRQQFHLWSLLAGGLIGFSVGCRLLRLSVKRTRKTYEIDPVACVACGKCWSYCPQNKSR